MNRFREKMMVFMQGRYGMDQLGRGLSFLTIILLLLSMFFHLSFLYIISVLGLVACYFRMFSKNISRRYEENQKYLNLRYKLVYRFGRLKNKMKDRRTNCIFKCPNCSQKIRVPRGKGRISIKCPKCRIEFIKKT